VEEGIAITQQEAWESRNGTPLVIPQYVREIVEQIAFSAREDKKIDKRSGVSQRLPISCLEIVVSNAERRALMNVETKVVPRISDIYAALPAITGKLELEYEGELKGGDAVARELIRTAIRRAFDAHFGGATAEPIVQWFDLGGQIKLNDTASAKEALSGLKEIQGLFDHLSSVQSKGGSVEEQVSAAEFFLEGLYAHNRIGRSEERVFKAEKHAKRAEKTYEPYAQQRSRRQFN
jgi:magnesium chelatase subunit I